MKQGRIFYLSIFAVCFLTTTAGSTVFAASPTPAEEKDTQVRTEALLQSLTAATNAHAYGKAKQLLQQLKKSNPGDADVLLAQARLDKEMGLFSDAMRDYQTLVQKFPGRTEGLVALSDMYLEYLDAGKALTLARQAVHQAPTDRAARLSLCSALIAKGDFKEAQEIASRLLKDDANDGDVYYVMSRISKERGSLALASEQLQTALKFEPNKVRWLLELSEISKMRGDFPRAEELLVQVQTLEPGFLEAQEKLAILREFYCHDYNGAIAVYQGILRDVPDSVTALAGIDRCKAERNDVAGTIKFYLRQSALRAWRTIFPRAEES